MTVDRDSLINYAIPKINAALIDRPADLPDEAQVGQGTIGAMAVGAGLEAALEVNIRIHTDPKSESHIGGSEYLAGAVLFLSENEVEGLSL